MFSVGEAVEGVGSATAVKIRGTGVSKLALTSLLEKPDLDSVVEREPREQVHVPPVQLPVPDAVAPSAEPETRLPPLHGSRVSKVWIQASSR